MKVKSRIKLKMAGLISLGVLNMASVIGTVVFLIKSITTYGIIETETETMDVTYEVLTLLCLGLIIITLFMFRSSYKKMFVEGVLEVELPQAKYLKHDGFKQGFIDSSIALVEPGNKYKSEDMISGDYKGIYFQQSDVTIDKQVREKQMVGNNTRIKVYHHFAGRMIALDMPVKVKKPVYIYSHGFEHRHNPNHVRLTTVDIKDKEFDSSFVVLTSKDENVEDILTDKVRKALLLTYSKYSNMAVRLEDNKMYIAINTKENTFDWKLTRGLNYRREIDVNRKQIRVIKDIVDVLKGEVIND